MQRLTFTEKDNQPLAYIQGGKYEGKVLCIDEHATSGGSAPLVSDSIDFRQ